MIRIICIFFIFFFIKNDVYAQVKSERKELINNIDEQIIYKRYSKADSLIQIFNSTYTDKRDSVHSTLFTALILKSQGELEASAEIFNIALEFYEDTKDYDKQLTVINLLAQIYRTSGNLEISNLWYRKGLKILESHYFANHHEYFLNNYANNLNAQKQLDSALLLHRKAETIRIKNNLPSDGKTLYNIGTIFSIKENHLEAIKYYKKSLEVRKQNNDSSSIIYPINEIALSYVLLNDLKQGEIWLQKAENTSKTMASTLRFHDIQAEFYRRKGSFPEYDAAMKKYLAAYKEILNDKKLLSLQELNERYESDKKNEKIKTQDLLIDLSTKELIVQDQNLQLKNNLILVISLIGVSLLLLALFIWQRSSRLKKETTIDILKAKIEGEERTKTLISANMHDFVLSDLHAIRFKLEGLQFMDKIDKPELKKITEDLRLNTKELRTICHELSPLKKDDNLISFKEQIENNIKTLTSTGTQNFSMNFDEKIELLNLNNEIKNTIIAILKESITNCIKHAKCTAIHLNFISTNTNFEMNIEDNGAGIDNTINSGIGLSNMKNRANLINARLDISSNEKGTIVKLILPL